MIIYNVVQLLVSIVLAPIIVCVIVVHPKYRGRICKRLGYKLDATLKGLPRQHTIWIHALSVGEVASVRTFVEEMRKELPESTILFSSTTRSGEQHARVTLADYVDAFISFPLDNFWVTRYFVKLIKPELFVLVETDFWPNIIHFLRSENIPSVLINGRISEEAYVNYQRFRFLFRPLFQSFNALAVQREEDVEMLKSLGVNTAQISRLGNLKYDVLTPSLAVENGSGEKQFPIPEQKTVWVAGSTHPGEEEILFAVFKKLQPFYPELFLIIAPREIGRAQSINQLAIKNGIEMFLRTETPYGDCDGMILNTLGELASIYSLADFAFVGGSLVPKRGHNPLEPAAKGKVVLFGPHMEDFIDIVTDMLRTNIAIQVNEINDLEREIKRMLSSRDTLDSYGDRASEFVQERQGVTRRHIDLIREVI